MQNVSVREKVIIRVVIAVGIMAALWALGLIRAVPALQSP
jgi:hypothetical protein